MDNELFFSWMDFSRSFSHGWSRRFVAWVVCLLMGMGGLEEWVDCLLMGMGGWDVYRNGK